MSETENTETTETTLEFNLQQIIEIELEKKVTLYKDGFKLLPETTNIPSGALSEMINALQTYKYDIIDLTTETVQYMADYNTALNYDIQFTNSSNILNPIINLSITNIPLYQTLNIRINNSVGATINFNTHTIISSTEKNTYNIIFKNTRKFKFRRYKYYRK